MKNISVFTLFFLINSSLLFSQVAINVDGSSPDNSAMLDVKTNNKGFLPPRMTRVEMNAIPNPADGLIVFCTDCRMDGKGVLSTFMNGNWNSLNYNCFPPTAPLMAMAPNWVALKLDNDPPKAPTGVRAIETINTSFI